MLFRKHTRAKARTASMSSEKTTPEVDASMTPRCERVLILEMDFTQSYPIFPEKHPTIPAVIPTVSWDDLRNYGEAVNPLAWWNSGNSAHVNLPVLEGVKVLMLNFNCFVAKAFTIQSLPHDTDLIVTCYGHSTGSVTETAIVSATLSAAPILAKYFSGGGLLADILHNDISSELPIIDIYAEGVEEPDAIDIAKYMQGMCAQAIQFKSWLLFCESFKLSAVSTQKFAVQIPTVNVNTDSMLEDSNQLVESVCETHRTDVDLEAFITDADGRYQTITECITALTELQPTVEKVLWKARCGYAHALKNKLDSETITMTRDALKHMYEVHHLLMYQLNLAHRVKTDLIAILANIDAAKTVVR